MRMFGMRHVHTQASGRTSTMHVCCMASMGMRQSIVNGYIYAFKRNVSLLTSLGRGGVKSYGTIAVEAATPTPGMTSSASSSGKRKASSSSSTSSSGAQSMFKKIQPPPLPLPQEYQQTLSRSFTLGGVGLHTGEFVIIRVRPAFANEGRYFVMVEPNTNADKFQMEKPQIVAEDDLSADIGAADGLTDEARAQLYMAFLKEKEAGDFDGDFGDFLDQELGDISDTFFMDVGCIGEPESPSITRGSDDLWVEACIETAESYENVSTKLVSKDGKLEVLSVESILGALEQCGVDNARIELEFIEQGNALNSLSGMSAETLHDTRVIEVPVGDGSALPWSIEIQKVGVKAAELSNSSSAVESEPRNIIRPSRVITVQESDSFISFYPSDVTKVTAGVDNDFPNTTIIGRQWFTWSPADAEGYKIKKKSGQSNDPSHSSLDDDDGHYRWEVAPARITLSIEEAKRMVSNGLLRAGPDFCCLVAQGNEWLDPSLERFSGEDPSRYAVAKLVGNLALAAAPGGQGLPIGHIIAYRASTSLQLEFAKAVASQTR